MTFIRSAEKAPSKIAHVWNRVLETGWRSTGEVQPKPSLRAIVCGLVVRVFSLGGRKRLGNALYQRLSRNQDVPGTLEYGVYCEPRTLYYPAEIFEGTCEVSLSGERWMARRKRNAILRVPLASDGRSGRKRPTSLEWG